MDYENQMKLWIDSAKTCSQLATAAMFLPVFWMRELAAIGKDKPLLVAVENAFFYCWLFLAVAIALSHTYQITAVKLISTQGSARLFPRVQYWLMVVALLIGIGFFVYGAMYKLPIGALQPAR